MGLPNSFLLNDNWGVDFLLIESLKEFAKIFLPLDLCDIRKTRSTFFPFPLKVVKLWKS